MFSRLLEVSWEASRLALFPLTVAAFGLPIAAVQAFAFEPSAGTLWYLSPWLPVFPLLAICTGFTLALTVWNWDHQGQHIYALSLPVTRSGWALEKMSAGILLMCLPASAFAAGSFLSTAFLDLPDGLHAYPLDLSLRFFFACLVAYSIMFALAAGSIRTATLVMGSVIGFFTAGQILVSFGSTLFGYDDFFLLQSFLNVAQDWPGPLHVFVGDWMLVDV